MWTQIKRECLLENSDVKFKERKKNKISQSNIPEIFLVKYFSLKYEI